ncbi:hypothetical protein HKBW3S06_01140 [Candidatus Hakubella thermalkaliphila]|uniref:Transposase IS4-like domain-containing protein n=1 Tax=Candidatus Hakubella thermalkaliphila TaxID=2754717 RepID=A0A6V8NRA1_9ACTN|nr:hypothetical protein HKBW3S06_01140 [Candidatus Hakubella thermalkaliphila]
MDAGHAVEFDPSPGRCGLLVDLPKHLQRTPPQGNKGNSLLIEDIEIFVCGQFRIEDQFFWEPSCPLLPELNKAKNFVILGLFSYVCIGVAKDPGRRILSKKGQDPFLTSAPFSSPPIPPIDSTMALRAYFVDKLSSKEAASRFGYSRGSFRVLVHQFRQNPHRPFFLPPTKGPQKSPKRGLVREQVLALRKENLSIYDISRVMETKGHPVSAARISLILKEEGFARLPRRKDEERPAAARPVVAPLADARQLDLSPRQCRTRFGGLFLFMPFMASLPFDQILHEAGFPGSKMIPAGHAVRSLLALKLFGSARHSHVMSYVLDEGLALFAGLNAIPKRSFLTEYSCRIDPQGYPRLMRAWFDALETLGIDRGSSFDCDFHTIPFHGEDALVEKHYVSKRSRRQKGILAFLAQDAATRVFCYTNADVRKETQNDEILRFVEFWKQRTGRLPEELIFDSKLTTYKNLNVLNQQGIAFITLRRRSLKMLREVHQEPASAWRRIELHGVSRIHKTPRIIDRKVTLKTMKAPFVR